MRKTSSYSLTPSSLRKIVDTEAVAAGDKKAIAAIRRERMHTEHTARAAYEKLTADQVDEAAMVHRQVLHPPPRD